MSESELAKRLRRAANNSQIAWLADDLRTAAEVVERAEWRPIAEAPKDGRGLLMWGPWGGCPMVGYWESEEFGWCEDNDKPFEPQPTVFMTLPPRRR